MNKKVIINIVVLISSALLIFSCDNDDGPSIKAENDVNEFIWKGLNSWYFWQEEVTDLSDDRFETESDRNTFINQYSSPKDLFDDLRHENDRFSWIVEDYNELDKFFQGTTKSFGFEYGLVGWEGDSVIGYVQYVLEGSPASSAELKRGDIFYAINEITLTRNNYSDLLFNQESYQLSIAKWQDGVLVADTVTTEMIAVELTENPVLLTKVLEIEGVKIGYLVYNGFVHTFHRELNAAFGELKNAGITEFVLDLRYNSGGSIYTAMHLASMIYEPATASDVFGKILFNRKHGGNQLKLPFRDRVDVVDGAYETVSIEILNEINVDKLIVLVSQQTASASELIIVGLLPYMDVKLIGSQTVGKNEASRTLYDSPVSDFTDKDVGLNLNHTWAIQPITSKLANSLDFSDYSEGFIPDIEIREIDYLSTMKPLGDPNEILLKTALEDLLGIEMTGRRESPKRLRMLTLTKNRFENEMHLNGIK
jgi:C-terminal processing protease CtpA/Prc